MILGTAEPLQTALIAAVVSFAVAFLALKGQAAAWQREDKRRVFAQFREAVEELERVNLVAERAGVRGLLTDSGPDETEDLPGFPSAQRTILLARSEEELLAALRDSQREADKQKEHSSDAAKQLAGVTEVGLQFRRFRLAWFHLTVVANPRTLNAADRFEHSRWHGDNKRRSAAETLYLLEVQRELGYVGWNPVHRFQVRKSRQQLMRQFKD